MHLPGPDDLPGADVVFYDGACRMCTRGVEGLARWDGRRRLAYLSLHDPEVARRFPDLTHEALMQDMHIVDTQGVRRRGAAAFRYLSRKLPRLWWLAPVLHIPGSLPIWQWLYRQVARRRYKFGRTGDCVDGSCAIHARK